MIIVSDLKRLIFANMFIIRVFYFVEASTDILN